MQMIFNFSAGPAMLPHSVLHQVKEELHSWNNMGVSVMEVSHRSEEFVQLMHSMKKDFCELLNIPENYEVLFCHGGARGQFSAIPMNLLCKTTSKHADYINTGYWSYSAALEAKKYCVPRVIDVRVKNNGIRSIQSIHAWDISSDSIYIHYCPNETIDGIAVYDHPPKFFNKIVVADCSSMLLTCPIDVSRFGIIYAASQKNIGISGLTVVIIRRDLLKVSREEVPSILNYKILAKNYSMFNTPVTISWYIASLVLRWLKNQGGLEMINRHNLEKSKVLYAAIDSSDFYYNDIDRVNRSCINVPFFLRNKKLTNIFLQESISFGLYGLSGHRSVGGIRASLYNAMSLRGVKRLVEFMNFFSKKYS
ncbi:3-phosphoserine/phosphohydroxythreonine transaminase [Candidatus Blochmannia ocreatus (nom. nud.)]|uniref:Phosphoserine aminotransferase n=1 Tax=Candidatus Blochmannia ocreatus (nom. nud.) TaxID=251538 RepID=A0ABY4SSC6_9ENTR|nr:3-phosphoserine/phosphohydroxythreonine transaminase [Candidatus Blochmannia ocreatus]URJ24890.1 3-phosphoserine/phosphohydroxythreonine transaminase [Candidatus Blochmannia ocreatus]